MNPRPVTHRRSRKTLGLAASLCLAAPALVAQTLDRHEPADDAAADRTFTLGTIYVYGTRQTEAEKSESALTREDIERLEKKDVGTALSLVPGVVYNRAQGSRYESTVRVRGYDLRAVPIMIDGIPVYIPYNGFSDLGRFTTADVATINVAKGYSSVMYGHNTMGGAINIVTMRPRSELDLTATAGVGSGGFSELNANLGSLQGNWYVQGGASYQARDYTRLSDTFVGRDADGNMVDSDRYNYLTRDRRASIRLGYVPNETDEYVLSYSRQEARKMAGRDEGNGFRPTGWEWPSWDRDTVSFVSTTRFLGDKLYLKPRVYYDTFQNTLDWWLGRPQGNHYDDKAFGASIELGAEIGDRHLLKSMVSLKDERHREFSTSIYTGAPIAGTDQKVEQQFLSVAIEDTYTINQRWEAQLGAIYSRRSADAEGMGEDVSHLIEQYPLAGSMLSPSIDTIDSQLAVFYKPADHHALRLSIAKKTRFPSFQQAYSNYGSGSTVACPAGSTTCTPGNTVTLLALQNPGLASEKALHYELGYLGNPLANLSLEGSLYYSRAKDAIGRSNRDFVTFPGYAITQSVNLAGVTERKGLDFGLRYDPSSWLTLGLSYGYLHIRNKDDSSYRFPFIPEHSGTAFADIRATGWLAIVPSVEFRGSSPYDTAGTNENSGYALASLKLSITPPRWKQATVNLGVDNLFDKNYRGFGDTYPSPGREWFLNLRVGHY